MKKIYSLAVICLTSFAFGQINLNTLNSAYTQDFDGLASTGTGSTTLSGTLLGWTISETGSNSNSTYTANNGSSNSGDTYSYGTTGSTDRALGAIASGSLVSRWGAQFKNNSSVAFTQLLVSYIGEEWRLGDGARGTNDQITFEISTDATSLSTGTWTPVSALTYNTTDNTGTAGLRDGNSTGFRTSLSSTITGLNIAPGQNFWIRFVDVNIAGTDDGLAIDDFSLTPQQSSVLATNENKLNKDLFVKNTLVDSEINFASAADVKIYNFSGQVLKSFSVKQNDTVDVSDLAKGNYIVTGIVNGKKVSEKIIKR